MDFARTTLMSAMVKTEDTRFEVSEVKPLFRLAKVSPRYSYDITGDGQRILALVEPEEAASAPLTFVVNWPALIAK